MSFLSTAVQQVLEDGSFCAVATSTPRGPHCTPLVFASSGGRIWLTTSRGSVKSRAWKADPSVAGLVRHGGLSNHPPELVERALAVGPVAALQFQYSALARDHEQELLPYALQHELGVIVGREGGAARGQ